MRMLAVGLVLLTAGCGDSPTSPDLPEMSVPIRVHSQELLKPCVEPTCIEIPLPKDVCPSCQMPEKPV